MYFRVLPLNREYLNILLNNLYIEYFNSLHNKKLSGLLERKLDEGLDKILIKMFVINELEDLIDRGIIIDYKIEKEKINDEKVEIDSTYLIKYIMTPWLEEHLGEITFGEIKVLNYDIKNRKSNRSPYIAGGHLKEQLVRDLLYGVYYMLENGIAPVGIRSIGIIFAIKNGWPYSKIIEIDIDLMLSIVRYREIVKSTDLVYSTVEYTKGIDNKMWNDIKKLAYTFKNRSFSYKNPLFKKIKNFILSRN